MTAYYNDTEPYVCDWLERLIAAGHIAAGDVDRRSIVDVSPDDLRRYTQCHFFAGIGGWSYALRLAGWPDDRPVWTGSCPCQPFSVAGAQRGHEDERHLWPAFFRLIRECRPAAVFGEQVAGAAGLAWLDHVCADLEGAGYAVAAADLPACSVGAPHRRQRLWWVADAERGAAERRRHDMATAPRSDQGREEERQRLRADVGAGGESERMADADRTGSLLGQCDVAAELGRQANGAAEHRRDANGRSAVCGMANASSHRCEEPDYDGRSRKSPPSQWPAGRNRNAGAWSDIEWLPCSDGKARPTQPGLFPLAHGVPARVGRLRAYGNAIVPQVAAEFIKAVNDVL